MKNVLICLTLIGVVVLGSGCKKEETPTNNNHQLIVANYTVTKAETSNTNNGTDWRDITYPYHTEFLKLDDKKKFVHTLFDVKTGSFVTTDNVVPGTWSLSADGNTLTLVNTFDTQVFTIVSLTATDMVVTTTGLFYIFRPYSSSHYPYLRITLTRS